MSLLRIFILFGFDLTNVKNQEVSNFIMSQQKNTGEYDTALLLY